MRKWFILLITLVLLIPSSVKAQDVTTLKSLQVRLWSEYDQPSMLVIYELEVSEDTLLPTTLEIKIPRAGNITAVAYNSEGSLLVANYQTEPSEDANWQSITLFITERTTYRVEYYQPLNRDGEKRSFTYQWTGEYPVNDFNVEIRVPQDSKGIKTNPAIPFVQGQSFLSGGAMMTSLGETQTYKMQLDYSRASEETILSTAPSAQVEPIAPVNENTEGRSTLNKLPVVLGGFGAVLILAALVYYLRSQSDRTPKPRKRPHHAQEASGQIHCHECGTRAHKGDRFCRTCGSKLRT